MRNPKGFMERFPDGPTGHHLEKIVSSVAVSVPMPREDSGYVMFLE